MVIKLVPETCTELNAALFGTSSWNQDVSNTGDQSNRTILSRALVQVSGTRFFSVCHSYYSNIAAGMLRPRGQPGLEAKLCVLGFGLGLGLGLTMVGLGLGLI